MITLEGLKLLFEKSLSGQGITWGQWRQAQRYLNRKREKFYKDYSEQPETPEEQAAYKEAKQTVEQIEIMFRNLKYPWWKRRGA